MCITVSPPKAKPNSSDEKRPIRARRLGTSAARGEQFTAPVRGAVFRFDEKRRLSGRDRAKDPLETRSKIARLARKTKRGQQSAMQQPGVTWSARSTGGDNAALRAARANRFFLDRASPRTLDPPPPTAP